MRCFSVLSSEAKERVDPLFFSQDIFKNFDKNFEVIALGQVITSMKSGFAAGKANQGSSECGIVQIRPTNIDTTGTLIFDKNVYIDSEIVTKKPEQIWRSLI